jgi:hypothetical protein
MSLRLAIAIVAGVTATLFGVGASLASYATSSTTQIAASADHASNWLHLYSQSSDPAGLGAYATQRVQTGTGPLCATGVDGTLVLVMGGIRSSGTSSTFNRTFTIQTPATFPVGTATQVTVAATYVADPTSGLQPIRDCRFSTTTATRGNATVTLAANAKYQANIRMRARTGQGWVTGMTYHPILRLTVTFTGSPASYYVYNIPLSVTVTTW